MKKFEVITKKRASWLKDEVVKFKMTDKAYAQAEDSRKVAEGRCKTNYFGSVESIVERLAYKVEKLNLSKEGQFIAHIYKSSDDYAKSCKFQMMTSYAKVTFNGRKIENIEVVRTSTCESYITANSQWTAQNYISRKLGLSDSDESVIAMAEQHPTIRMI